MPETGKAAVRDDVSGFLGRAGALRKLWYSRAVRGVGRDITDTIFEYSGKKELEKALIVLTNNARKETKGGANLLKSWIPRGGRFSDEKRENVEEAERIRLIGVQIEKFLPIRSSNNDKIDRAADLEIGQLFYVCKENRDSKITEFAEYKMIRKMRDARNTLAHWEILSYEQLKELGMI